jgi:N-acyl-D-aspartate/D-glutamate deacylase
VNGNCGMSIAPLPAQATRRDEILRFLQPVLGALPTTASQFHKFSEYAKLISTKAANTPNVFSLVGLGTVRASVCGYGAGARDETALRSIHTALEDALGAGALGVSIGLSYLPDAHYDADGLVAALAPLSGSGLPLVCHIRGEGDLLYDSVQEVLGVAKRLQVPLHISHFKCIGRANWGHFLARTIALIDAARDAGQKVDVDVYPWTAGSTQMVCLLPPAFLEGGMSATARRLRDPAIRAACRAALEEKSAAFENIIRAQGWDAIMVSAVQTAKNQQYVGKRLSEVAAIRSASEGRAIDPYDAFFDLLADEECNVTMVDFITTEEDIDTILRLPYSSVISDALYTTGAMPHPRNFANTAMLLGEYVAKRKTLSLETAIHKLTALPAGVYRLPKKGLVKEGFDADLCLFREGAIRSAADYVHPAVLTEGFDAVIVGGRN